jgi:hypothetical protein
LYIEDKLSLIGLKVESKLVRTKNGIIDEKSLINDYIQSEIIYLVHLNRSNKETKTINLILLNSDSGGIRREFNNLSINDSLRLLTENFSFYNKTINSCYMKIVKKSKKRNENKSGA